MSGQSHDIDAPARTSGHILVVDDEKNIRTTLQMVLTTSDFRVDVASDGDSAEALLQVRTFDMVLLDVRMPGRSGLQLLDAWKKNWPDMLIILMSGEATLSEALDGLKQGAFDFLEKPILTARLLTALGHGMERVHARKRIDLGQGDRVVGTSPQLTKVFEDARKIANTKARVLITGESGTGKDLVARYIHLSSARKERPFVKINCASIPAELIESELFGHVKGAFTGATNTRRGHFESAHGGTLFLDEVGELPLSAQAKMLRVLQNGEITPLGTSDVINVDVRVIAATNRNLKVEVEQSRFREDLYYRLAVVTMHAPALRERKMDVLTLVNHFVVRIADDYGIAPKSIDESAARALGDYHWPGNIRELRNVVERCMILSGAVICLADLPPEIASCAGVIDQPRVTSSSQGIEPWHQFKTRSEREHILKAIDHCAGNMTEVAKLLQVERQTIYKWLKTYDIGRN